METYKRLIKLLKEQCPLPLPVQVRRVVTPNSLDGDCQKKEDHFRIRIDRTLPEHEAIETILHEWAHALIWEHSQMHTNEWGKAYSRVYRVLIKEVLTP